MLWIGVQFDIATGLPKSSMCSLHVSLLIMKVVQIAATVPHSTMIISQVYKHIFHTFLFPISVCELSDLGAHSSCWVQRLV